MYGCRRRELALSRDGHGELHNGGKTGRAD